MILSERNVFINFRPASSKPSEHSVVSKPDRLRKYNGDSLIMMYTPHLSPPPIEGEDNKDAHDYRNLTLTL